MYIDIEARASARCTYRVSRVYLCGYPRIPEIDGRRDSNLPSSYLSLDIFTFNYVTSSIYVRVEKRFLNFLLQKRTYGLRKITFVTGFCSSELQ